ncbi:MAG TPA: amidohydrolase family protein [Acidimicrobiales bacterium]
MPIDSSQAQGTAIGLPRRVVPERAARAFLVGAMSAPQRLVLTNSTVLDGESAIGPDCTVVVEGSTITTVAGTGSSVEPGPADQRHDLAGRTVMPGLITCHFHSTYHELGSVPTPFGFEHPPAYQALLGARNLRTALECGYTGAVSAGAANDVDPSLKRAVNDGLIPGPRFLPGSRELSTTGHSNDSTPWYWNVGAPGAIRICNGAEGFRLGVRDEIKRGAEIIKLFVTGGHGTTAPKERTELTRDELAAAIDTAHDRDALIRGHIANKPALLLAVELGIDIVDHGDDMDDECIAAMVETGTYLVPSLYFPKHFIETMGTGLGFTEAMKADLDYSYEVLPKANAAGVRILVGDDYGAVGFPHGLYGHEFTLYADEVGIPALDVMRWATRHAADLLGRPDLGTVAEGATADLVVVDGDPLIAPSLLADAAALTVIKDGSVVSGALPGRR